MIHDLGVFIQFAFVFEEAFHGDVPGMEGSETVALG